MNKNIRKLFSAPLFRIANAIVTFSVILAPTMVVNSPGCQLSRIGEVSSLVIPSGSGISEHQGHCRDVDDADSKIKEQVYRLPADFVCLACRAVHCTT